MQCGLFAYYKRSMKKGKNEKHKTAQENTKNSRWIERKKGKKTPPYGKSK